jgi:pyruvate,water dikinase
MTSERDDAPALRPLTEADATCGGKAHGLARAMAAGLHVPDGFVIGHAVFAEVAGLGEIVSGDAIGHALDAAARRIAEAPIPETIEREVRARAGKLGQLAVRSSASIEDGVTGAAAGVFESVTDVAADDVWRAVRAVWASALAPLAVAYARRRAASIAISVIVQRFVPGARATVYTRPIGAPRGDAVWISRADRLDRVARGDAAHDRDAAAALAAEAAIAATDGADVELVHAAGDDAPWVVQARPMVHPVRAIRRAPPPILVAPLVADGRRWTWDITHNPDPLSPAQAGLVEHVDRLARVPYASRLCGGYLYTTPREAGPPAPPPLPPADAAELAARIAAIEARLVLDHADSVATAVARFVAFVERWAVELSPLVAAARRPLLERLAREAGPAAQLAGRAAALIGPRRAPRDGVMAPAWDVAVPTFAESGLAVPAVDRARAPAPAVPPALVAEVELARAAADAAEHDDLWFARAQWLVRRALLAHGRRLTLRGDDVFWLPLDELIAAHPIDPDDAHRRAAAARAAHARAAEWDMPRVVHGDRREAGAADATGGDRRVLRGIGSGPRVVGRVIRFATLAQAAPVRRGDVVVTRAITPALAMVVDGCAALISETGGLLDHGAAMARELGISCVVGCAGAWSQLTEGDVVVVDGDAGLVERPAT